MHVLGWWSLVLSAILTLSAAMAGRPLLAAAGVAHAALAVVRIRRARRSA